MTSAQRAFVDRLGSYQRAVDSPSIVDLAPNRRKHNAQARLLRNGLCVVGFALIEDFIRSRTGEILDWLTRSRVSYLSIPAKLQAAVTHHTVRALGSRYDIIRRTEDVPSYLAALGGSFASLIEPELRFPHLSLGWRGSNLGTEEVKELLASLEVVDGWGNIERIAHRAGLGGTLSPQERFDTSLRSRHVAAHQATANIQPTDLQYFARDALGIALGFDAVASRGARLIAEGRSTGRPAMVDLQQTIRIRFLQPDARGWREYLEASQQTIRRGSRLSTLEGQARRRAQAHRDLLVVLDGRGNPYRWRSTDVP